MFMIRHDDALAVANLMQLYGILEYRSMEATKLLAERSQLSAENMEDLTRDMDKLARETKGETVSMRIITLVTLFFLPGTFISVGHSRYIFSTQLTVVSDDHEHRYYSVPENKCRGATKDVPARGLAAVSRDHPSTHVVHFFSLVRGQVVGKPRSKAGRR
jgi:hypothetical protein